MLDYAGARVRDFTPVQRRKLLELVELYVGNMDESHARVKMDEVMKYHDRTHFAWIGGSGPDSVFYYRIHSPVILIEFDHQTPANLRQFAKNQLPTREHIHCVVRTPNGNDYRSYCGSIIYRMRTRDYAALSTGVSQRNRKKWRPHREQR